MFAFPLYGFNVLSIVRTSKGKDKIQYPYTPKIHGLFWGGETSALLSSVLKRRLGHIENNHIWFFFFLKTKTMFYFFYIHNNHQKLNNNTIYIILHFNICATHAYLIRIVRTVFPGWSHFCIWIMHHLFTFNVNARLSSYGNQKQLLLGCLSVCILGMHSIFVSWRKYVKGDIHIIGVVFQM